MAATPPKPVFLLTFASELAGVTLPLLAEEVRRLRAALRPAEDAGLCEVVVRQSVTLADILNVFQDPRYHGRIALFHFAGHADAYDLLLTDAQGNEKSADATGFAAFLAEQPGLDVVFLNACSTQPQVDDLLTAGVKAVIATGADIPDDWALPFAERLYTGLAGGSGLASAFRAAEAALRAELGEQAWPWGLFPAPDGGALAGWRPKTVTVAPSDYLWVNVPVLPTPAPIGRSNLVDGWIEQITSGAIKSLAIHGMPGIGKTTLALLLAHDERLRRYCPDGVLWAPLGQNGDVASIQVSWMESMGCDLGGASDPLARQERLSRAVGDRRILVVLDDVWDRAAAKALRFSGPRVVHILTTRNEAIALEFGGMAGTATAPLLDATTAWDLLQQLAPVACTTEPVKAKSLADSLGGLPLAVELVGGYLAAPYNAKFASQRQRALASATNPSERLALLTTRLGYMGGKPQTLEAIIRLSIEEMQHAAPEAAAAFWRLGAFAPKPATFGVKAATEVAESSEDVLALLAERNLIEIYDDERMTIHQVLHDVATAHTPAEAAERHQDYYLGVVDSSPEDWQRIEQIYEQIRFAWRRHIREDHPSRTFEYVRKLGKYQERQGFWQDKLMWCEHASTYAEKARLLPEQASMLIHMGFAQGYLGESETAFNLYAQALALFRQLGDITGASRTLNNIGNLHSRLGHMSTALDWYRQALGLREQANDKVGQASTLNNIGAVYSAWRKLDTALAHYERALQLFREENDRDGEATTLNNIGNVQRSRGDSTTALKHYDESLNIWIKSGNKVGQAKSLNNIGEVYWASGDQQKAIICFDRAHALLREVGNKADQAYVLLLLCFALWQTGDKSRAMHAYRAYLEIVRLVDARVLFAAGMKPMMLLVSSALETMLGFRDPDEQNPSRRQV